MENDNEPTRTEAQPDETTPANDRFSWTSWDQITPLHPDGTSYTPAEVEALKDYHRQRVLDAYRRRVAQCDSPDTEDCHTRRSLPRSIEAIRVGFNGELQV